MLPSTVHSPHGRHNGPRHTRRSPLMSEEEQDGAGPGHTHHRAAKTHARGRVRHQAAYKRRYRSRMQHLHSGRRRTRLASAPGVAATRTRARPPPCSPAQAQRPWYILSRDAALWGLCLPLSFCLAGLVLAWDDRPACTCRSRSALSKQAKRTGWYIRGSPVLREACVDIEATARVFPGFSIE